jgi:hypothetical protein
MLTRFPAFPSMLLTSSALEECTLLDEGITTPRVVAAVPRKEHSMASDLTSDLPVACTLSADDLRARGEGVVEPLFARAQRLQETPDGYRFAFPAKADGVRELVEFILSERDCCPFFTFELAFPAPHQSVWLTLRGGDGVKEFVAGSFAALDMPLTRAAAPDR